MKFFLGKIDGKFFLIDSKEKLIQSNESWDWINFSGDLPPPEEISLQYWREANCGMECCGLLPEEQIFLLSELQSLLKRKEKEDRFAQIRWKSTEDESYYGNVDDRGELEWHD